MFTGIPNIESVSVGEVYRHNLLKELRRISPNLRIREFCVEAIEVTQRLSFHPDKAIARYLYYPIKARKYFSELNHVLSHADAHVLGLLPKSTKKIASCYDLYPISRCARANNFRSHLRHFAFRMLSIRGLMAADTIITISNFSKEEIATRIGYPRDKIRVIYEGVDHDKFKPAPPDEKFKAKYNIGRNEKTALYVGSGEKRKNLPTLLHGFKKLTKKYPDVKLMLVGRLEDHIRNKLQEFVKELGITKQLIFTGYVPSEELPKLYNVADVLVFPTLYEGGFGLPILEAMSCGVPVIVSNIPPLKETVGIDTGIMVDPRDVNGFAKAMYEVLTNDGLREEMIKKGLKRAQMFSWKKVAKEMLQVYEELMVAS